MPFPFMAFGTGVLGVLGVLWWLGGWHSVLERAFSGTEYACRAQKGLLRYATRFQKRAVPKTPFYGTEEIFGAKNRLLWYATNLQRPAEQPTPQTVDSPLPDRTHFRGAPCQKQPTATLDASSVRETAPTLFVRSGPFHHFLRPANAELVSGGPFPCSFDDTRYQKRPPLKDAQNSPRSEVSRHKKVRPERNAPLLNYMT